MTTREDLIEQFHSILSKQRSQHVIVPRGYLTQAADALSIPVEGVSRSQPGYDGERAARTDVELSGAWREIESGVTVRLTARHLDATLGEGWHVHDFDVTIWRKGEPWTDGRSPEGALETLLNAIAPVAADGVRELPPEMWSNEAILRACSTLANVTEAHVNRPGYHARARR